MKRSLASMITVSLAALAVCAAVPIAVATPGTMPMTGVVLTAVTEQQGFTVVETLPTRASAPLVLTVHRTRNARVEAYAGRNLDAAPETYTVGGTPRDADNSPLVLTLAAPAGGWKAQTTYQWGAAGLEAAADAYARGTFTTPAWNPGEDDPPTTQPPGSAITTEVQAPSGRHRPLVLTVTGVRPDEQFEASVHRVATDELASSVTATGAVYEGGRTPVVLPAPDGGWAAETEYAWRVWVPDRGTDRGVFTTSAWRETESRLQAAIQLPKAKGDPVVITVTGAEPGATVTVSLGDRPNEWALRQVDTVADQHGRAVATFRPGAGGWTSGARHYWAAWEGAGDPSDGVTGTLTMPTWNKDGGIDRPPTRPKDRSGGMAKTGL